MSEPRDDPLRRLMFSIAYRMLGSVAEAEDIVQDAFVKLHLAEHGGARLDNSEAFATTVTTRLAIDALRSARVRREQYVGTWLPEPVLQDPRADPARSAELDESLSVAVLVLMEQLSPVERAVFVLREVVGYDYAQITEVVEKSESACRQVFSRARRRIDAGRPEFDPDRRARERVVRDLVAALRHADLAELERLLLADVVFDADGGGVAPAVRRPVHGAVQVARLLRGLNRAAQRAGLEITTVVANGQPAFLMRLPDGIPFGVLTIDIADGRIIALHNQINPAKLAHLGRSSHDP